MKKTDILLTGEGPTDYGWKDNQTRQWKEGPIIHLIKKCAEQMGVEVAFSIAERPDVERIKLQRRSMQGLEGKAIPARKFYVYMNEKKYAHGIYYCDADRDSGRSNTEKQAKRRFAEVYEEVRLGANPDQSSCSILPMVALRMIESWLLADIGAYEAVYGEKAVKKAKISLPSKPELIWGKEDDPNSEYPKNYFKNICERISEFHDIPFNRQLYADLAEQTDLNVLAERCEISFKKFQLDFEQYL